jgi:ribonuclease H / adenosylcobalamin/alpha-ribazole phosphatase
MAHDYILYADGASRGNPGAAAYGAAIYADGHCIKELYEAIGIASNNFAEYRGLIAGLQYINQINPAAKVEVRMDSKLVVEQMSGGWKIKHADMKELSNLAYQAHPQSLISYTWIPRENNSHADSLANKALDEKKSDTAQGSGLSEASSNKLRQINYLTERVTSGEVPTTIYFIRHGETPLTPSRSFSGGKGSNPGLSEIGKKQAAKVALEIAARKPEVFIASPLLRTTQTAEIINEHLKLPIEFDPRWIEADFGKWDEQTPAAIAAQYPVEWDLWRARTDYAPPGGESYDDLVARVEPALVELGEKYPGQKVLVVTHNIIIRAISKIITGAPMESFFHIDVAPCSITTARIYPSDGLQVLTSFSETSLRP